MSTHAGSREYEAPPRPLWLRIAWFVLVGWWASGITLLVAYLSMITIIGLPLAFWLFDRVPFVLTLRPRSAVASEEEGGVTHGPEQLSLLVRAVYFVLVGWWLGAIWMCAAYALFVTLIGIPVGIYMLDRIPTVVTLQRN